MKKQRTVTYGRSRKVSRIMPLHNALAAENWPQHVQDEIARLSGAQHVPDEEKLVCAINGSRIWALTDVSEGKFPLRSGQLTACCRINGDLLDDQIFASEPEVETQEAEIFACQGRFADDDGDDRLDTLEKIQAYYRNMYPWLFTGANIKPEMGPEVSLRPSFHGVTRQNIAPKPGLRAEPNAKKRRCKRRGRKTIRDCHFNEMIAESEQELAEELMA